MTIPTTDPGFDATVDLGEGAFPGRSGFSSTTNMTATTKADKPIPLSELVPKSRPKYTKLSTPKLVPNEDGLVVIETPLPCLAYLFMLPFPFLCMGCCLFQQSRIILDDASRLVTVHVRNGACPCATKRREFSYSDVGNVAVVPTSMRVNGVRMHTTIFLLRDATRVRTGRPTGIKRESVFVCQGGPPLSCWTHPSR